MAARAGMPPAAAAKAEQPRVAPAAQPRHSTVPRMGNQAVRPPEQTPAAVAGARAPAGAAGAAVTPVEEEAATPQPAVAAPRTCSATMPTPCRPRPGPAPAPSATPSTDTLVAQRSTRPARTLAQRTGSVRAHRGQPAASRDTSGLSVAPRPRVAML